MSDNADRVEVFAGIQRRCRYIAKQKMAVVLKTTQPGSMLVSQHVASQYLRFNNEPEFISKAVLAWLAQSNINMALSEPCSATIWMRVRSHPDCRATQDAAIPRCRALNETKRIQQSQPAKRVIRPLRQHSAIAMPSRPQRIDFVGEGDIVALERRLIVTLSRIPDAKSREPSQTGANVSDVKYRLACRAHRGTYRGTDLPRRSARNA